ncbi:hypothetical protein [Deinococcus sedimenti]|uniref:DUF4116 domain-containing protein n=1 Tax=Deinococcus sedimenti TaxID=1867090 RepID=A0ABQ2S998_9DEIO|nr:hypothetical protein [Deinococcus sedimenti]GGS07121.1 hypothetical protein GCM10008960_36930 [Deinococcus sedimenti]
MDPSPRVRAELARRLDVPLPVLDHLAQQRNDAVVQAVAVHPQVPDATLRRIVLGSRALLALHNATLSPDLLLTLEQRYPTAHAAITAHPSHPCHHADPAVRLGVFTRDNAVAWAALLQQEPPALDTHLSALALGRPALNAFLAKTSPFETVQATLAGRSRAIDLALAVNPRLAPGLWHRLAARGTDLRCALADHPRLPDHLALAFARDPVVRVRLHLAARAHLPPDVNEVLMRDQRPSVRETLARSTVSPVVIDAFAQRGWRVRAALTDRSAVTLDTMACLARHDLDFRRLYPHGVGDGPWIDVWLEHHLSDESKALSRDGARMLWALLTYAALSPQHLHRIATSFVASVSDQGRLPGRVRHPAGGFDGFLNRPGWWTALEDERLRLQAAFLLGLENELPAQERSVCMKIRMLSQQCARTVPLTVFGAQYTQDARRAVAQEDARVAGWLACLDEGAADVVRSRTDDAWIDALLAESPWPVHQVPADVLTPLTQARRVSAAAGLEEIQVILSAYNGMHEIPEVVVLAIGDRDDLPDLYRWTFRTAWWFDALEDIGGRLKAMDFDELALGMATWGYDAGQVAQTLEDLDAWPYE